MRVKTSSKKKQALNLNVYRNLHHRSLHAQKTQFEKIVKKLLRGIPPLGTVTLHYEVYVQTKRRLDVMNVGSIVDKYFSDCLTNEGVIIDDDYKHIPKISFSFGGLVKSEHVLVTITEIEKRKESKPMRVLLDTADIQKALTTYVAGLNIPNASGVRLSTTSNGDITAEVLFDLDEPTPENKPEETAPKKRGRGGRPRGSKNLPKTQPEETADVDAPVQDSADSGSAGDPNTPEVETSMDSNTETREVPGPQTKATKKGNLFGDEETPSSEDDSKAEADPSDTPEPIEPVKKKKGSIFDA